MNQLQHAITNKKVVLFFQEMKLGLEKESQRVTLTGELATSEHPKVFGNRSFHPYIQTDFSETQMELITPVTSSPKESLQYLSALHDVALQSLNRNEMLWPLSMPPKLPQNETKIKIAKLERFEEVLYRRYLARAYGKRKQMVSGIHYNFEFSPEFIDQLFLVQNQYKEKEELRTYIYLKVARNYLRYRWLITYLFAASPIAEEGYFVDNEDAPRFGVRSIRNSQYGYTNHKEVKVSYRTIEDHVNGIYRLVEQGILSEEKEFYAPVRLRGGTRVSDLKDHGVNYIEIRNIDLNPYTEYGIDEETIRFLQLFLMYMLWIDNDAEDVDELVLKGDEINNEVALELALEQTAYSQEGREILAEMQDMLEQMNALPQDFELLKRMYQRFNFPEQTIAGRIMTAVDAGECNREIAIKKGLEYKNKALERPYQLTGFENMELSTQILLFDAIQKGLRVEVLDENDQFVKLRYADHIEYVKNANMTSKDQYVVPLIMENKTVTKKILAQAGFRVPNGMEFQSIEEAMDSYERFSNQAIVVKPKSTNYGLGISIFKEGVSVENYQKALDIAFAEDQSVLVEEFFHGTEYRFCVIDQQVKAILLRIPANIRGDGVHTVRELVIKKNQDPLRGTNHRAPLEKIELGALELLMLQEQNCTPETIPENDQIIYLRENSNISTGGDSIDVTDECDDSYKKIAVEAVEALGAKICGIDLIIPDKAQPANLDLKSYGIIEANFNPAMHMHIYPYAGEGQRLTMSVLQLLFPEVIQEK